MRTILPIANEVVVFLVRNGKTDMKFYQSSQPFNLPDIGLYRIDGFYTEIDEEVYYPLLSLPRFERNPKGWKVKERFRKTDNIADIERNILLKSAVVSYDPQFWYSFNPIQREYIRQHEMGHLRYETETFCDHFAENQMVKMGYNPHQIHKVIKDTIQDKERIENSLKRMTFSYENKQ